MLTDHFVLTHDRTPAPAVLPADEPEPQVEVADNERSVLGLTELLLKNPDRLDRLTRDENRQPLLIPSFLAVGLASFSLFALALVLTLNAAPLAALPEPLAARWPLDRTGSATALWLAYALDSR